MGPGMFDGLGRAILWFGVAMGLAGATFVLLVIYFIHHIHFTIGWVA